MATVGGRKPVVRRHEAECRVCGHPQRQRIESEWCAWANTTKLAKKYGLSRDSLYRHAAAFGLYERRGRGLRAALGRIIEAGDAIKPNASAVIAAITAFSKINAAGQWIDRTEQVNLNDLFERMTPQELETYAREGALPDWFTTIVGATPADSQEDKANG